MKPRAIITLREAEATDLAKLYEFQADRASNRMVGFLPRTRAAFYAQAAGYRSVRLLSISENGDMPRPIMVTAMRADSASAKTAIEPGQLSTSVTLSFQYALEK